MKQLKPSQAARASFEPLAEHEIRMEFWRKWNSVVLSTESLLSTELFLCGYKKAGDVVRRQINNETFLRVLSIEYAMLSVML